MGIDGDWYNLVLLLHLVSVVVGFGPLTLNGLYGAQAKKRRGVEGAAIGEANFAVSMVAEKAVYLVPVFGIFLILLSDDAWSFSDLWISLSFLLYIVGLGLSHAVMIPSSRRMNALARELATPGAPAPAGGPPPQVAEMEAIGKRLATVGGILNLLLVVLIALMVWKPT